MKTISNALGGKTNRKKTLNKLVALLCATLKELQECRASTGHFLHVPPISLIPPMANCVMVC